MPFPTLTHASTPAPSISPAIRRAATLSAIMLGAFAALRPAPAAPAACFLEPEPSTPATTPAAAAPEAAAPLSPELATAAKGIRTLLDAMTTAVLAGDAAAYMALVDPSNSEFLYEQRYFANDLTKAKPTEFELVLDEASLKAADPTAPTIHTADFTMRWRMGEKKKPRELTLRARFVQAAPASAANTSPASFLYAGEEWLRHEEPGVIVFFDPGLEGAARKVAADFLAVKPDVEAGFELSIARPMQIKLYGTMLHLQASIMLSYEDGLGGWNEPNESIKILISKGPANKDLPKDRNYKPVLAHELGHACTFELGPNSNNMPWWILEGVAELATETVSPQSRERVNTAVTRWAEADNLATWDEITTFGSVPRRFSGHVYTQGHHFMGWLSEKFGRTKRNAWLSAMSKEPAATLDEASRQAFGKSWEDLSKAWRDDLPWPKPAAPTEPAEQAN